MGRFANTLHSNSRAETQSANWANHNRASDTDLMRVGQTEGRINNLGHIVGTSNHLSGFIWRGKRMESLNALIDPAAGWDISNPIAINDAGQIAAVASRNGVHYAVRLDLIRPHVDAAPALEPEAQAELLAFPASPALETALAKAEAQAQEREVVRPMAQ